VEWSGVEWSGVEWSGVEWSGGFLKAVNEMTGKGEPVVVMGCP
jgi:hypothetical protein